MTTQKHISIKLIAAALLLCMTTLVPSVLADNGQLPAGVYSTTIVLADIPAEFPPEAADLLVGTWAVEFAEDGTTVVRKNGEVVVTGNYTASKSHLVMRDQAGPLACFDARGIATGIYTWSIVNGELHLTTVLDRCFGRMFVLTLRPMQQS